MKKTILKQPHPVSNYVQEQEFDLKKQNIKSHNNMLVFLCILLSFLAVSSFAFSVFIKLLGLEGCGWFIIFGFAFLFMVFQSISLVYINED